MLENATFPRGVTRFAPHVIVGATVFGLTATSALAVGGLGFRDDLSAVPFFVACALIGAVIVSRQPRNPVGWMLAAGGLCFLTMTATGLYALYSLMLHDGRLPGTRFLTWPQFWLWAPGAAMLYLLVPLHFPNGSLVSHRWRSVRGAIVVVLVLVMVVSAIMPGAEMSQILEDGVTVANPYGLNVLYRDAFIAIGRVGDLVVPLLGFLAVVATTAHVFLRFRASEGIERQQMKWFASAVAILMIGIMVEIFVRIPSVVFGALLTLLPVAIGIAIVRHNLYDIDQLINRSLDYGMLSAAVIATYVFVVGYVSTVASLLVNQSDFPGLGLPLSLVATGVVAVLFHPVREHLQRAVNQMMYGDRDDPYAALSRLGERLENSLSPDIALDTIVETVRDALRLPYVAISLYDGTRPIAAASTGARRGNLFRLPLNHRSETLGELVVAPRAENDNFGPDDQRLLGDLARQIGVAALNIRLAEQTKRLNSDLQRSREQIVLGREEERRRLRRELHDGLAPTIAALNLKAGQIRRAVRSDPGGAEELLDAWRSDARAVIGEVRRLAYDLRPPVLDELGLGAAIRERSEQIQTPDLLVSLDLPDLSGSLPAAVEVAAYRIIQEALLNVERHVGMGRCVVRVRFESDEVCWLTIVVSDDGGGRFLNRSLRSGVGLLSMREHAAELGGSCSVEYNDLGGVTVSARLPVDRSMA